MVLILTRSNTHFLLCLKFILFWKITLRIQAVKYGLKQGFLKFGKEHLSKLNWQQKCSFWMDKSEILKLSRNNQSK